MPLEVGRARSWENWYRAGRQVIATLYGLLAVILGFCWINLTIFDAFTPGTELAISFDRLPARDLTLSLSWAVYALLLLGVGVARRSTGLRWTSLAMLMITIAKVFLYDLGELTDLYRVFSLFGLSISLILVSLLYQRFVFRRDKQTDTEAGPTA